MSNQGKHSSAILKNKKVIIAPLDWGLGHATRCIPIINFLLEQNAEVQIAGCGSSFDLLKNEYPELKALPLTGYDIRYPRNWSLALSMLFQTPGILYRIRRERLLLKQMILDESPDLIISDNRYGTSSNLCKCVFITHQLVVKVPQLPVLEALTRQAVASFAANYDECWVPDVAMPPGYSGDLGHITPSLPNCHYIGPLSRFRQNISGKAYDLVAVLSGPDPMKKKFEDILKVKMEGLPLRSLIVRGRPEEGIVWDYASKVDMVSHLDSMTLNGILNTAGWIVCRAGYSSIMDIASLGKKALLIPTPGQTEQEYLALNASLNKFALVQHQDKINLNSAADQIQHIKGFPKYPSENSYHERLNALLS